MREADAGMKCIIFSQFTQYLDLIGVELKRSVPPSRLNIFLAVAPNPTRSAAARGRRATACSGWTAA
jgi:hypothetical protein